MDIYRIALRADQINVIVRFLNEAPVAVPAQVTNQVMTTIMNQVKEQDEDRAARTDKAEKPKTKKKAA